MKKHLLLLPALLLALSCTTMKEKKTIGSIERTDSALNALITEEALIEVLAEGYQWSEGPVWVASANMLLFSDVPANTIYKWTEKDGVSIYLTPSGYTGSVPSQSKEPGSNGLTLDGEGRLILCQHGDRRLARMDAPIDQPQPSFITLADSFEGKKLNSPNDVAFHSNGSFFFTDPPYGLPMQNEDDPAKELPFQGVFKVSPDGKLTLLTDSLTRPNGIVFTPDGKTMIVANSDPQKAIWYAYDLTENDSLTNARVFYDATAEARTTHGLPDGLKIDKAGNIFATGPGGVWIFDKSGKVLGKIKTPVPAANCALADDDKTLFVTAKQYLLRVRMRK